MIIAYVHFTDFIPNIGCVSGTDIYDLLFADQIKETGDQGHFKLEVLPRVGEWFQIHGNFPVQLEVVEIRHSIVLDWEEMHSCQILFKLLPLSEWSKPL